MALLATVPIPTALALGLGNFQILYPMNDENILDCKPLITNFLNVEPLWEIFKTYQVL